MEIKITVERRRGSVTQGSAVVLINGTPAATFGDTIELIAPGEKYYGEIISGWASKTPDTNFVLGMLCHPYDEIYHLRDLAKKVLEDIKTQEEQEAQTYKKVKAVKYVATDTWGRMVFVDESGKVWKYTEPGENPMERHDRLYDSGSNDIYGEPGFPLKVDIDYKIVEEFV